MPLFGNLFGKKENGNRGTGRKACTGTGPLCDCDDCAPAPGANDRTVITVMGTGCKKCHQLHENALEAAKHVDKTVEVEYVTDLGEIAASGVMSTPALLIDGKVVSAGKMLAASEIEKMLG